MRVLVTGAGGFLGKYMWAFLVKKGHTVGGINYKKDLRIYENVLEIFKDDYDYVFHLATHMGGVGYMAQHPFETFVDSMRIDVNVFQAAKEAGIKRLFYPASSCMYPDDISKLKEKDLLPADPSMLYGYLKLSMTQLAKVSPFETRVGILDTVFGEGQAYLGDKAKFPTAITYKVIQAKRNNTPIEIWGNGKQTRTLTYVEDAIEKIYEIMMADNYWGEVNVASEEIVTVKQCADWLCEIAEIKPKYKYDRSKAKGVLTRKIDNSKFNRYYRYRNQFTTRQGFEKLYHWMKTQV